MPQLHNHFTVDCDQCFWMTIVNKFMKLSLLAIIHSFVDAVYCILFVFKFFLELFVIDMIFLTKV